MAARTCNFFGLFLIRCSFYDSLSDIELNATGDLFSDEHGTGSVGMDIVGKELGEGLEHGVEVDDSQMALCGYLKDAWDDV